MTVAWSRVRSAGRGTVRACRTAAGATVRAGNAVAHAGRGVGHATRKLTHAQGAGRTGLGRLIELTAVHSAGDALITVSLAGALFFGLPVGQARGKVALYLLITMIPFAVVAPFVGPVLDRFRSGRRYVMAGTLFARGLLCWGMASAVDHSDTLSLLPAALAVLVLSKAYNVSRAAIMPSVLPADITLVTANARVALFALVAAGGAAGAAAGLTIWLGAEWVLRAAMLLFLLAGIVAVRLPRHVDSPDLDEFEGPEEIDDLDRAVDQDEADDYEEVGAHQRLREQPGKPPGRQPKGESAATWRSLLDVGPIVGEAMRANAAIRVQGGFLIFFLLFLVQDRHLTGPTPEVTIGLLAAAAGGGGLLGAAVASWARTHSPQLIVLATLGLTTVTTIVTALFFTLWSAVVVALVSAFAQGLGKLALDAIVQQEIGEEVRSATFGVVEALLQIAWVLGGLIGLLLSLFADGPAGFLTVSATLVLSLGWLLAMRRRRLRSRRRTARRTGVITTPITVPVPAPAGTPGAAPAAGPDTASAARPRRDLPAERSDAPADTKPLTNPY